MKDAVELNKDKIAEMIRGERSAVETYRQVMKKYGTDAQIDELREFSSDHRDAVRILLDQAKEYNIDTPDSSGAWGSWAKLVTEGAKLFGEEAALKALKEGEEHGLKMYNSALDTDIPTEMRQKIEDVFIPAQKKHIRRIDNLMEKLN